MNKIYIIGGANVDIYAKPKNDIIPFDSNIGDVSFEFGGVGRNIAENINNLGGDVSFISCFGNDAYGKEMANDLINKGISLDYSRNIKDENTSVYIAILNKDDMYIGVNDMEILNHLQASYLKKLKKIIDDNDMVVFDSNLQEETINYIATNIKGLKIADAISCNKVNKLKNSLNKIDILKLNKLEAIKLCNKKLDKEKDILSFTKQLNKLGTKEVLISCSKKLYIGINEKLYCLTHNGYIKNPINVSGAGDALLSGYAYSRFIGKSIIDSASIGIALSIFTVQDIKPVTKISFNKIKKLINDINVEIKEVK